MEDLALRGERKRRLDAGHRRSSRRRGDDSAGGRAVDGVGGQLERLVAARRQQQGQQGRESEALQAPHQPR
jgi:hypothetical protein